MYPGRPLTALVGREDVRHDALRGTARTHRAVTGVASLPVGSRSRAGHGLVVALGEIDAQSGRMVDGEGRAWPFSVLVGPGAVERSAGWSEVLGAGGLIDDPLFRALLSWHLAVDVIFLLAYGCLLTGLVAVLYRSRVARRLGGDSSPSWSPSTCWRTSV